MKKYKAVGNQLVWNNKKVKTLGSRKRAKRRAKQLNSPMYGKCTTIKVDRI